MLLRSLDSRTNSSPWRSTSKLSVRKISAAFESFSRNHAEQAFSACRISRTLSRARRIFWPDFPILAKSSCTRSLGAGHPVCAGLAGLHGFTDGTLTGGASQGELRSPFAMVAACGAGTTLPGSLVHARPSGKLARGRGSAAWPMKLTACGSATVPERLDAKRTATARKLRGAEYIFLSRPDLQLTTDRPGGSLPDGRQPEAARGRVEPQSGTKGKDEVRGAKPPQTFLE